MSEEVRRILICDDEPDVREMVGEYLERRGFEVVTAANAEELRTRLGAERFDAVVLDINMPEEDGLSALRRLRVDNDLPVLMLTAASEVVDRIVGLEMGADDYLGKPVDLRELEARIKAVIRRRGPSPCARGLRMIGVRFGRCTLDIDAGEALRRRWG